MVYVYVLMLIVIVYLEYFHSVVGYSTLTEVKHLSTRKRIRFPRPLSLPLKTLTEICYMSTACLLLEWGSIWSPLVVWGPSDLIKHTCRGEGGWESTLMSACRTHQCFHSSSHASPPLFPQLRNLRVSFRSVKASFYLCKSLLATFLQFEGLQCTKYKKFGADMFTRMYN